MVDTLPVLEDRDAQQEGCCVKGNKDNECFGVHSKTLKASVPILEKRKGTLGRLRPCQDVEQYQRILSLEHL